MSFSQFVGCRAHFISGTQELKKTADNFLPEKAVTTTDFAEMQVFITFTKKRLGEVIYDFGLGPPSDDIAVMLQPRTVYKIKEGTFLDIIYKQYQEKSPHSRYANFLSKFTFTFVYVQSNYITPGFTEPTKLFFYVDEIELDIYNYVRNLVFQNDMYPETFELTRDLREAVTNDITFLFDSKVFENSGLKELDLSGIKKVKLVDLKRNKIYEGSVDVYNSQVELKELGLLAGKPDGVSGPDTRSAIAEYKKLFDVDQYKTEIMLSENKHRILFEQADDFVKYHEKMKDGCEMEFCINEKGEATLYHTCGQVTAEISTKGEMIVTISEGSKSYDFVIINGEKPRSDSGCEIGGTICFRSMFTRNFDLKCGENSFEISSNSSVTLSAGNFSTSL